LKTTNQLVVLSGILVILATATIAATYNVMIAEAKSSGSDNFGQTASGQAHGTQNYANPANGNGILANRDQNYGEPPTFGNAVSGCAKGPNHC
jgi:hypothetical protein